MPGVRIRTDVIAGPATPARAPGAPAFFAGITERGPVSGDIPELRSMADFERFYGTRASYATDVVDAVETLFAERGGRCRIARAVGPAATKAKSTLVDRAGAPLATLDLEAVDPGAWANVLTFAVADGAAANTFTITISGTPDAEDEVFRDLPDPATAAAAISAGSRWVNATNRGSVSGAPTNNPAIIGATLLGSGAGTLGADDRAAVTNAIRVAALNAQLPKSYGAAAVAIPGQTSANVGAGLLAHCAATSRIAVLAPAVGQTPTQAQAARLALQADVNAEFGELVYPWVRTPAGGSLTRLVSPEAYVMAKRAVAHEQVGPHQPGAGEISKADFVLGPERELTQAEVDSLDAAGVVPIRTIAGSTRVYGCRSLSNDEANWANITYRDLVNVLDHEAQVRAEVVALRAIDGKGHLFAELKGLLTGIAAPYARSGALYPRVDESSGDELDPGFVVDVAGQNTLATLAANELHGRLAVRPSPVGSLVDIVIAKAALTAPL